MAVGLRLLRRDAAAGDCLRALETAASSGDGGVFAACHDGLSTGIGKAGWDWLYYRRRHVAATCWYLFAELGWNPYWARAL